MAVFNSEAMIETMGHGWIEKHPVALFPPVLSFRITEIGVELIEVGGVDLGLFAHIRELADILKELFESRGTHGRG